MEFDALTLERDKNNGCVPISKFTQSTRPIDLNNLEVGDEFEIPTDYQVYSQPIGSNSAEFIYVNVNGVTKKLYPSIFWKSRIVMNENMTSTGKRVYTTGAVADDFRKHATVAEAMEALKGKKIKIVSEQSVRCKRYGLNELMTTNIPVIEYA